MSAIQSMSIGRRLGLLMAASTGVALLLSYAASAYSQIDQYQRDTRAQLSTLADITATVRHTLSRTYGIGVGIVGMVVELLLVRRLYGKDPLMTLVLTFALSLFIEAVIRWAWGSRLGRLIRSRSGPAWAPAGGPEGGTGWGAGALGGSGAWRGSCCAVFLPPFMLASQQTRRCRAS